MLMHFFNLSFTIAVITLLLQHEPDKRPTALELSQSPLLPSRLEDEYFKGALGMMGWFHFSRVLFEQSFTCLLKAKPDSPHHQTVLNSLFKQPPCPSRAYLYDIEADPSEYASLNNIVKDHLAAIFHLHGAVDMEPPLLMPVLDPRRRRAKLLSLIDMVTLWLCRTTSWCHSQGLLLEETSRGLNVFILPMSFAQSKVFFLKKIPFML